MSGKAEGAGGGTVRHPSDHLPYTDNQTEFGTCNKIGIRTKEEYHEKRKKEILDLGWKNNQTPNIEEEMCVIVIGNKKYIEEANKSLKINDGIVIDCYYFDDIKDNITEIAQEYEKNLNTKGIQDI